MNRFLKKVCWKNQRYFGLKTFGKWKKIRQTLTKLKWALRRYFKHNLTWISEQIESQKWIVYHLIAENLLSNHLFNVFLAIISFIRLHLLLYPNMIICLLYNCINIFPFASPKKNEPFLFWFVDLQKEKDLTVLISTTFGDAYFFYRKFMPRTAYFIIFNFLSKQRIQMKFEFMRCLI